MVKKCLSLNTFGTPGNSMKKYYLSEFNDVKQCKYESDSLYKVYSDFLCENEVFKLFWSPNYQ